LKEHGPGEMNRHGLPATNMQRGLINRGPFFYPLVIQPTYFRALQAGVG
jgi:hypothetical protein